MNLIKRYKLATLGALLGIFYLIWVIHTSTSSTPPIGFIFLPFYALGGAFIGHSFSHFFSILKNPKLILSRTSLVVVIVYSFTAYKILVNQFEKKKIAEAKDPKTSLTTLKVFLSEKNSLLTQAVAKNSALTTAMLDELIVEYRHDYGMISAIVLNPNLTHDQMRTISKSEEADFKGKVDYRLFQTFAWAPIARRKDVPADIIHSLARKPHPEHFLILALIENKHTTCKQISVFLPQLHDVLINSIKKSLIAKNCRRP